MIFKELNKLSHVFLSRTLELSCVCINVSTGQLSGGLRADRAFSWPHNESSTPALDFDQLAVLGLLAPLPARPATRSADPLRLDADHRIVRGSLLCRLVSCQVKSPWNGSNGPSLNLTSSFSSKCSIKRQIWQLKCKSPLFFFLENMIYQCWEHVHNY